MHQYTVVFIDNPNDSRLLSDYQREQVDRKLNWVICIDGKPRYFYALATSANSFADTMRERQQPPE